MRTLKKQSSPNNLLNLEDSLIITTDFAVARFQPGNSAPAPIFFQRIVTVTE